MTKLTTSDFIREKYGGRRLRVEEGENEEEKRSGATLYPKNDLKNGARSVLTSKCIDKVYVNRS